MEKCKIGVVGGLGHIGLVQSACLAGLGYQVIALDTNNDGIKRIGNGEIPFREPDLTERVARGVAAGMLQFTNRVEDLQEADLVYICVGTPSLPGGEADTRQVEAAVETVALRRDKQLLIAIKSTVPVGTARKLQQRLQELKLPTRVCIVSNPEFLSEGSGIADFLQPARIVAGAESEQDAARVAGIYSPPGVPMLITSWENAELIKYASNAFLATKISFINQIAAFCEKAGADIRMVGRGIGLDPRIGRHFLEAGVGYSGPCLIKDLGSLISQCNRVGAPSWLLQAVAEVNKWQQQDLLRKLEQSLGSLAGKRVGLLGLAFKPLTDDVRNSHSLPIIRDLLGRGALVSVHDPWVVAEEQAGTARHALAGVEWVSSPYQLAEGKDAILILTGWPEYKELDLARLKSLMARPLVVDGRNLFEPRTMQEIQIDYQGVGLCSA